MLDPGLGRSPNKEKQTDRQEDGEDEGGGEDGVVHGEVSVGDGVCLPIVDRHIKLLMRSGINLRWSEDAIFLELFVPVR